MTAMETDWRCLEMLVPLGGAMAFLLVGWRLGRASAGRPGFGDRDEPGGSEEAEAVEEADPWTAASIGATAVDRRPGVVDIFETLRPDCRTNSRGEGRFP
jgi:hypothetical protein